MAVIALASAITAVIVGVTVGSEPSGRAAAAEEVAKKALGDLAGYPRIGEQGGPDGKSSSENDLSRHPSGREGAAKGVSGGQEKRQGYGFPNNAEEGRGEEAKEQPRGQPAASGPPSSNAPPQTPQTRAQTAHKPESDLQQPQSRSGPNPTTADLRPESRRRGTPEPNAQPGPNPRRRTLPGAEGNDWQRPTQPEIEAANAPRHYHLLPGAIMALTIKKLGIYDAPVFDSDGAWALASGISHVPGTSLPWSPTPERNVYLAGHRMGFRGTWSRMLFYNLGELKEGDEVVLRDGGGRAYEYRVSETFLADPGDSWVMGRVRGRDMVTLQTCTPLYTFEKRLIVRADRV